MNHHLWTHQSVQCSMNEVVAVFVFADRGQSFSAQTVETAQHTRLSFITCMNPAILTDQFNLAITIDIND